MIGNAKLFKIGFKKALLINKVVNEHKDLKGEYPYTDLESNGIQKERNMEMRLYFQNECIKRYFDNNNRQTSKLIPFDERLVGILLGFPEVSVEDYMTGIPKNERVLIDYHGLCFVTNERNVQKALDELNNRNSIPEELIDAHDSKVTIQKLIDGKFSETKND